MLEHQLRVGAVSESLTVTTTVRSASLEGAGANVLGSPWPALLHYLVELRSCLGAIDVDAGEIVTTGTWTDAWPVPPARPGRPASTRLAADNYLERRIAASELLLALTCCLT